MFVDFGVGMYSNGWGVTKDEREAAKWYRKAADQEHGWAQYAMGRCCLFGIGVSENRTTAQSWLHKAYENTDDGAKNAASKLWAERPK